MRVDKYLKVARILKKRTIAKALAEADRLLIGERPIKASYEVKIGDEITIVFGHRTFKIRVLEIKENASKQDALSMYEVIEESVNEVL